MSDDTRLQKPALKVGCGKPLPIFDGGFYYLSFLFLQ